MPLTVDKICPNFATWAANQQSLIAIPNTDIYEHFEFNVSGTLTLASYTTAPSVFAEAPENLIAKVELQPAKNATGGINEPFKSVDLAWLRHKTMLEQNGTDIARATPSTANGAYAFYTKPKLFFSHSNINFGAGINAKTATAFDARFTSQTNLAILWRDQTAMVSGGVGGTASFTTTPTAYLKMRTLQGVGNVDAQGNNIQRYYIRELQQNQQLVVQGTQLDQVFAGLRTQAILKRLAIKTTVGGNIFSELSDVTLGGNTTRPEGPHTRFRVNQTNIVADQVYAMWQRQNMADYEVPPANWPVGHLLFDTAKRDVMGLWPLADMLDLTNEAAFDMMADSDYASSSYTANIQFTYEEMARTS